MIKIVIITSNHLRHKYFVNTLAKTYRVLGVISEIKKPNQTSEVLEEDQILKRHFMAREQVERKYFGKHERFAVEPNILLEVSNGESNSQTVFDWIKHKEPDFVILFGSSIIKDPLLSYYKDRIINIHLGLSPYYRGSGTNFWPLVNNQPECVGATIHLAALRVDAGSILVQTRPENINSQDNSHDLGCKTIIAGVKKMAECIKKYQEGKVHPQVQDLSKGQVFKRADFNAGAVLKMLENFQNGMMQKYLLNKSERDAVYPIVSV